MVSGITLKKGRLSAALLKYFQNYYRAMDVDPGYVALMWRQWKDSPDIIKYTVKENDKDVGWIIYNPGKSTIEEILIKGKREGKGLESRMVDALIARESLIAAEVLRADKEKYQWMVEYGFRPTRSFTADGFPLIKMDLSISVLFERLEGKKPARI
jgi:hypothetical protein